jgi:hypothetical protein
MFHGGKIREDLTLALGGELRASRLRVELDRGGPRPYLG